MIPKNEITANGLIAPKQNPLPTALTQSSMFRDIISFINFKPTDFGNAEHTRTSQAFWNDSGQVVFFWPEGNAYSVEQLSWYFGKPKDLFVGLGLPVQNGTWEEIIYGAGYRFSPSISIEPPIQTGQKSNDESNIAHSASAKFAANIPSSPASSSVGSNIAGESRSLQFQPSYFAPLMNEPPSSPSGNFSVYS